MTRHKPHGRTLARRSALALLYSSDITEQNADVIVESGAYPADVDLTSYVEALVLGVEAHRSEIDNRLVSTSENWALDRMPVVDRAILRLAVYEMLYVDDVPVSVAINEAVELAKAYGGEDDSSRFVNGILGNIARALESETAAKEADADADADADAAEGSPAREESPDSTSDSELTPTSDASEGEASDAC